MIRYDGFVKQEHRSMSEPANLTIVIPIYEGVTHLDFTGPHQFLARLPGTTVIVASVNARPVKADGMTFTDLADLGAIDHCDVLCVPGGNGCTNAMEDKLYMSAIRGLAAGARYITSVCTGSLILAAAGLLEGKRAACHWAWRDMLAQFGAIADGGRVVRDGNIITGGGVTAGIDFVLVVIAELAGEEAAQAVQLMLEYEPAPPFRAGRPELAPPAVRELVLARMASAMPARRAAVARAAEEWRRSTMAAASA
jgi:putative intracellular protease/amidase